jgi:hypothetical protein
VARRYESNAVECARTMCSNAGTLQIYQNDMFQCWYFTIHQNDMFQCWYFTDIPERYVPVLVLYKYTRTLCCTAGNLQIYQNDVLPCRYFTNIPERSVAVLVLYKYTRTVFSSAGVYKCILSVFSVFLVLLSIYCRCILIVANLIDTD